MKLREKKIVFPRKQKIILKRTYFKVQRENMIQKMKKTSLSKRMMNMVQKRRIKADVKPKDSKYRHKCLTEEYSLESAQIIMVSEEP